MINLEKELQIKAAQRKEAVNVFEGIQEVKLLLESNGAKEIDVLRQFNLADTIVEVEANRGEMIQMEKFNQEFGASYSIRDIQSLAIDYNLRFLPLNLYNGGVDSLLATKILEFCEKHDLDYRAEANSDSFYVLAPYGDFKLETNIHKKPEPRPIFMNDPLLFYKCDREQEVWSFVYKWGNEFTPMRLLTSMKYVSVRWYMLHHFLCMLAVLSIAVPLIFSSFFTLSFFTSMLAVFVLSAAWAGCLAIRRNGGKYENFNNYFSGDEFRSRKSRVHEER